MSAALLSDAERLASGSLSMVTCYDYSFAKALDGICDYYLVGDSVGMVVYGDFDTKSMDLPTLERHVRAVCRGAKQTHVVADMPIHSYDSSEDAAKAAALFKAAGAHSVKVEGASATTLEAIKAIRAVLPVMGHVGLTPQLLDAYKVQGRDEQSALRILEEALALQNAGCFAVVLECIPAALAQKITQVLRIPTIGIGAGPHCTGQVLVLYDLLGLYGDLQPKFVKRYADLGQAARDALQKYVQEVRERTFPDDGHSFK
ncbi:3-methyl-2-oxobutanoate hydroxymethyltransferase [Candidatus Micrarchaeota archaeon]|nr:3-methyl-2-oxobutanoate hydroxymethyltransferase [Candidatus Micrarchaeota archaeon]